MFVLTSAMRLKDGNYINHLNILVLCDQWKIISDLNMAHGKMSNFVSLPLFVFTLVMKLKHFSFKSLDNTSIFIERKIWCQIWTCTVKQCLIQFKLRCLCSILPIGWEIQILNLTEIAWYFSIEESVVRSKLFSVYFVVFIFLGIIIELVLN